MAESNSTPFRIDYVEYAVTDIKQAKAFYAGVFGWEFQDYGDEYTAFSDGRLNGGFYHAEHASSGGPLVVIYAENLEKMVDAVKDAGGEIVKEIFSFPGGRRFHFSDPGGNILAIWSDR